MGNWISTIAEISALAVEVLHLHLPQRVVYFENYHLRLSLFYRQLNILISIMPGIMEF